MSGNAPSRRDFLWQAAGAGVAVSAIHTVAAEAQTAGAPAAEAEATHVAPVACTLLPQQNRWRSLLDL